MSDETDKKDEAETTAVQDDDVAFAAEADMAADADAVAASAAEADAAMKQAEGLEDDASEQTSDPATQGDADERTMDLGSDAEEAIAQAADALNSAMPNLGDDAHKSEYHSDVAIAALCQSYAHALSMAFHDAVLQQQRRSALGQAALARAVEQIQSADASEFEEKLMQLQKGLDAVGAGSADSMTVFGDLATQFQAAANQLLDVRERTGG